MSLDWIPTAKSALRTLDERLACVCLPLTGEQSALLTFLFHGLFLDQEEIKDARMDPRQGITVQMFRRFVCHFQENGYQFVSPQDILDGLPPSGHYVLMTFDDGYYNNQRALPVLEEFQTPGIFFISTGHVKSGRAFWWGAVYREMRKRGRTDEETLRAIAFYKRYRTSEVESKVRAEFGDHALEPVSDLERPFRPAELAEFASHPLVHLGNHTRDHAILTNYSKMEIREQIQGAQDDIQEMTGRTPQVIAYPNGNESSGVIEIAREIGLRLGMICRSGKNRLPIRLSANTAMILKRFTLLGSRDIGRQCRATRSGVSLYRILGALRARSRAGHPTERLV
jgi:peptidoglycan/xylan/chitin deacetylase (PgdA/CDA1 family)